MLEPWLLLVLLATADSKVDDNVRYDSLIGRHMNVFSPYDGAKQVVSYYFLIKVSYIKLVISTELLRSNENCIN